MGGKDIKAKVGDAVRSRLDCFKVGWVRCGIGCYEEMFVRTRKQG